MNRDEFVKGLPQTWSDWVAFVGGLVAFAALFLQGWVIFADRARVHVDVALVRTDAPIDVVEPTLKPPVFPLFEKPRYLAIVRVTNTGRRPVRIESLLYRDQFLQGARLLQCARPFQHTLDENDPRAVAVINLGATDTPEPRSRVQWAAVVSATGKKYEWYAPPHQHVLTMWEYILQR